MFLHVLKIKAGTKKLYQSISYIKAMRYLSFQFEIQHILHVLINHDDCVHSIEANTDKQEDKMIIE